MNSKPPVYGKIHLALHFAIMKDALRRHEARVSTVASLTSTILQTPTEQSDARAVKRVHGAGKEKPDRSAKRRKIVLHDETHSLHQVSDPFSNITISYTYIRSSRH